MSNVTTMPGVRTPSDKPNEAVVETMRKLLAVAESGELQSFIGTGFMANGDRMSVFATDHPNVFEMAGAIAVLQNEYMRRTGVAG